MKFSPQNLESIWLSTETKLVEILVGRTWTKSVFLIIFLALIYPLFDLWSTTQFPPASRFYLVQDRLWAAFVLVGASFIPLFIRRLRHQPIFLFLVIAVSWLFPISKLHSLSAFSVAPLVFLLVGIFISRYFNWNPWLRLGSVIFLFCALVALLTYESLSSVNSKVLIYFSNIHLDILILFFAGIIFRAGPSEKAIYFNPLQLYAPMPLPDTTQLAKSDWEYDRQYMRGILQIVVAQTLFLSIIIIFRTGLITEIKNPVLGYIIFLTIVIGAFKNVTGILWIFGFQSPAATYFLPLAKNPLEIWQRGSAFFADFLFNKIYFPTWKKFRSNWLPSVLVVIVILSHLFIFHEILLKSLLRWQFGNGLFGTFGAKEILLWMAWLSVWLVWIFVFFGFKKITSRWHQSAGFQWLLVILTHLGTAMIFPLVHYLSSVLSI